MYVTVTCDCDRDHDLLLVLDVVIKYNKLSLIKKKHKNKRKLKQRPETTHSRRIHAPRRTPTSTGPSDQSEEARLSVTTNRHQSGGDITKENRRDRIAYTHRPRATRNKQQNAVTAGQPQTNT